MIIQEGVRVKMGKAYSFKSMPMEYNAWLVFRMVVDLVLFHDFAFYTLFTWAFWEAPAVWNWGLKDYCLGLLGGMIMLFSLWVKSDAHRVVKDYAWCIILPIFAVEADYINHPTAPSRLGRFLFFT